MTNKTWIKINSLINESLQRVILYMYIEICIAQYQHTFIRCSIWYSKKKIVLNLENKSIKETFIKKKSRLVQVEVEDKSPFVTGLAANSQRVQSSPRFLSWVHKVRVMPTESIREPISMLLCRTHSTRIPEHVGRWRRQRGQSKHRRGFLHPPVAGGLCSPRR